MTQVPSNLKIEPLGETALRIDLSKLVDLVLPLSKSLLDKRHSGVRDVVSAFEVVVIHLHDELIEDHSELIDWVYERLRLVEQYDKQSAQLIDIPVLYDEEHGEDLCSSAKELGITVKQLIELHTAPDYQVRMLGFMPGFPYLEGLDQQLALPRKSVPRKQVPTGSVGIGGNQTGVYPSISPGGWNLLGQTPLSLFNPTSDQPSLLQAGDSVRFRSISCEEFESIQKKVERINENQADIQADPVLEIENPGQQTILIDEGRWGYQHLGVSPGGPMDPLAAKLANELVNNKQTDALLECNLVGPKIRFVQEAIVAITGARIQGLAFGRPFKVQEGEELDLSKMVNGARSYVAIQGGFHVDEVLGSLGTDLRGQFGGHAGRALQKGDQLSRMSTSTNQTDLQELSWHVTTANLIPGESEMPIRVHRGPQADWFSEVAWERLLEQDFRIGSTSDRTGIRLACEESLPTPATSMLSEPIVMGSIQVPPSGEPIVLMADRQTVGGYPVLGIIASADVGRLAQLQPGESVRFSKIDLSTANKLRVEVDRNFKIAFRGVELHD